MARYSKGKHAYGICDRSGFKVRYSDLRTEWNGMRVHKSEYEEKHPSLERKSKLSFGDPAPLRNPRIDNDNDGTVSAQLRDLITMTHGDT